MTEQTLNGSDVRYRAPYLEWAKTRPSAEFDLAGSNILPCSLDDLPGGREAIALWGANDNGYAPFAVGPMKWDANVTAFSVMTAFLVAGAALVAVG